MEAFNFRIIKTANGAEIIDSTLSTPYSALTQFLTQLNCILYRVIKSYIKKNPYFVRI